MLTISFDFVEDAKRRAFEIETNALIAAQDMRKARVRNDKDAEEALKSIFADFQAKMVSLLRTVRLSEPKALDAIEEERKRARKKFVFDYYHEEPDNFMKQIFLTWF